MKLDVSKPIVNFEGTQMNHPDGKLATVGSLIVECLLTPNESDNKDSDGEVRYNAYKMAKRFQGATELSLNASDVLFLRSRVALSPGLSAVVLGQLYDALEAPKPAKDIATPKAKGKSKLKRVR